MKNINLGIIGVGTVGKSVISVLNRNKDLISSKAGANIFIKKIAVRNVSNFSINIDAILTSNIDDILNDKNIDIIIELIDDVTVSYDIAKKALCGNKILVTANKAMLANNISNIVDIITNTSNAAICFEASVAGGIPIINAIRDGLSANNILSIRGILNGTCNYILTKMCLENISFDMCLKEVKNLGYAESNPMLDISGMDSAYKLIILSFIVYGVVINPNDVLVEGICDINQDDMYFAREFGYVIKLLASAKKIGNTIEFRVHPAMLNKSEMLSNVTGVMNGVSVIGDNVGETIYCGAGAGGEATSSAVIGDIINIIRNSDYSMIKHKPNSQLKLVNKDDMQSKYYIRIKVVDRIRVMNEITNVLSNNNISIEVLLQKDVKDNALVLLSTHTSVESNIKKALEDLSVLDVVCDKPYMIRIEA